MTLLLDTDTFILLLRGTAIQHPRTSKKKSVAAAAKRIRDRCCKELRLGRRIGLSAISLAELEFGLRQCGRYDEKRPALPLQQALAPFEHFAFDLVDCVHRYGRVRAELKATGKSIGPLDIFIAAHALALDATLITHSTREFQRVKGLSLADWA